MWEGPANLKAPIGRSPADATDAVVFEGPDRVRGSF
jgi:hypothetical protein